MYEGLTKMVCAKEDVRPLLFFRYSFGFLMMVYCANKITDDPIMIKPNQVVFGYSYRIPSHLDEIMNTFPWFTTNSLYWKAHSSFLLLSATGIAYGSGFISCLSCFAFAILKIVLTLQDQSHYNNHEYLYSLLALAFGLVDCHQNLQLSSHGFPISTMGVIFLMIQNSLYGIAGSIAIIGCTFVWIGIVLHIYSNKTVNDNRYSVKIWNIHLMRVIIISLYTYAGIAKTDTDWYSGMTVRSLLSERENWIGPTAPFLLHFFNTQYRQYYDQLIMFMAYGGMMIDLLSSFGFLTSNNYIRCVYLVSILAFHFTNHYLFILETFPWVMMSSCAIFYSYKWLNYLGFAIELTVLTITYVMAQFSYLWKAIRFLLSITLLVIIVVIPFPCAWNSVLGNGDLQWGSQCQFFNWRMMTRSVKVISLFLRIEHPVTGNTDIKSIHEMGYDGKNDNGMECIAFYEDRLWDWVKTIKIPTENQKYLSPRIYADIFLEVNGPPIQRYIDPTIDISRQSIPQFLFPCESISGCVSWLFKKPNPLVTWVVPRISKYRSVSWIDKFLKLEKSELNRMNNNDYIKPEVVFIADTSYNGKLTMVLGEYSLVEILDGVVDIMHVGRLTKGSCIHAKGIISIKTVNINNSDSSLWMLSLPSGRASFGLMSYKEGLGEPLLNSNRVKNCNIIINNNIN